MALSDKLKFEFNEAGCVLVSSLISTGHAAALRKKVLELAAYEIEVGDPDIYSFDKSGKTQRVWNLVNKDEMFRELLEFEFVDEFMNYIFDRRTHHQKYLLSSFQANIIYPGSDRQKLHIDTPFPEPLPLWPVKANTIWFLDDFTELNGATEYLPGSHKFSTKPTSRHDCDLKLAKAIGASGSVLVTHGALWHRAGANRSTTPRIALLCSYAASYAREISTEEDHSIVIDQKIVERASPHLRKILAIGHGIKAGATVSHDKS